MKRDTGLLYKYSKIIGNLFEIKCNYEIHINTKCSPYCNAEWPSDKSTDDNCAHSNLKCTAIHSIVTFQINMEIICYSMALINWRLYVPLRKGSGKLFCSENQ